MLFFLAFILFVRKSSEPCRRGWHESLLSDVRSERLGNHCRCSFFWHVMGLNPLAGVMPAPPLPLG